MSLYLYKDVLILMALFPLHIRNSGIASQFHCTQLFYVSPKV